jgi:hypothetical protein
MCNQTVCLIAAELERAGIATASIILVREIAERVGIPRALAVPFPFGSPLGRPADPELQREVLRRALAMTQRPGPPPLIEEWT